MKLEIEIPKEFECDFYTDKFGDFFRRTMADMGCMCGLYEKETAKMLRDSFKNANTKESEE